MSQKELADKLRPFLMKFLKFPFQAELVEQFLGQCTYIAGAYDRPSAFTKLNYFIAQEEARCFFMLLWDACGGCLTPS